MSISATEAAAGSMLVPGMSPTTTESTGQADKQMFLELMVAQLRYQDPLNPTDSGEFLAQSAQFTALEKMQDVAESTGALLGAQLAFGASGLVNRHVTWTDPAGVTGTGTVDGVSFGAEGPVLHVGDTDVPIAQLTSVTASATTDTSSTTSDPAGDSTSSASSTSAAS